MIPYRWGERERDRGQLMIPYRWGERERDRGQLMMETYCSCLRREVVHDVQCVFQDTVIAPDTLTIHGSLSLF